jgi:hypothetical protein
MKKKISRTGSCKQKKMTRETIRLDIADAATVFLTRKIKIQPMEHYSNGKFKNNN